MCRYSASHLDIAVLAEAQHGVVSRAQLRALGLSIAAIDHRVRSGQLRRVHHGIYAVGHRVLTVDGKRTAAVLAAGADAVLSHSTAAAVWDLRPTSSGVIHVTVPGHAGRERRAGMRVHRSITLTAEEITEHRGLRITTPARTIVDLSRTLSGRPLEHVVDLADQRGLIDFADLRTANSDALQAVLRNYDSAPTRSEMEERFLRLCEDHRIPRPETNTRIEGIEVDFLWRHARLVVEVDGYRYHRSPSRFEWDREKDVILGAAGWPVTRFTWRQITRRRRWVATAVSARLAGTRRYAP